MKVESADVAGGADERSLARNMLDVHGLKAAVVARDNARAAARAGQRSHAQFWIRVLGLIQQSDTDMEERLRGAELRSTAVQLKDDRNAYLSDHEPQFHETAEGRPANQ